jgi:hypothetical protein
MRRFLLSVFLLLVLLWAADFVLGSTLARLFHASPAEDADWLGREFASRAPIIACGSSRVQHHYMVDSLATELGVGAYNLGQARSWGALYQYAAASSVLRHYTPRLWIMEVETGTYAYPERFADLVWYEPYVREEPAAAEVIDLRSPWEPLKRLSRIYPYNSLVVDLVSPYLGARPHLRDGFIPLAGSIADDPRSGVPEDAPETLGRPAPDSLKMHYLRKTLAALAARHVTVLAVRSPYWPPTAAHKANDRTAERNLREVFGSLGVHYLDFSVEHAPVFADRSLFMDASHLNERGALLFTRALAESIRALPNAPELLASEPAPAR